MYPLKIEMKNSIMCILTLRENRKGYYTYQNKGDR